MDGALVRRGRARIRRARDEHDDPPAVERRSASAAAGTPAKLQTSWPCSGSPGTRSGRDSAPSAITSWSPSSRPPDVSARRPAGRSRDLDLEELDAVPREQLPRPAALRDRSMADELPQLAQAHRELRLSVDEDDLVVVAEESRSSTAVAIPPKPPPRMSVRGSRLICARRRPRARSARTCRRTAGRGSSAP